MARNHTAGAKRVVPRTRGALSGIALIVLGAWGALIPFVGPYFNFSFTPDDAWHWTTARGWLEVLPGAAAFVAGLLLLVSRSRTMTLVAAWLGIAAGAWFAVGPQLQDTWKIGSPGQPAGSSSGIRTLEVLAMFTLLGVVVVYFAAAAFGRLSVVSLRDSHAAERREADAAQAAAAERQHNTHDRDTVTHRPTPTEHDVDDRRDVGAHAVSSTDEAVGPNGQPVDTTDGHTGKTGIFRRT